MAFKKNGKGTSLGVVKVSSSVSTSPPTPPVQVNSDKNQVKVKDVQKAR